MEMVIHFRRYGWIWLLVLLAILIILPLLISYLATRPLSPDELLRGSTGN